MGRAERCWVKRGGGSRERVHPGRVGWRDVRVRVKAKLKLLACIFHENQEPQPRVTLHRNIKFQLLIQHLWIAANWDIWASVAQVIGLLTSHTTELQENTPVVEFKEYWQRKSNRVTAGEKRNRKTNGSIPEAATSRGCQSPGDSATAFHGEGPTSSATLKDLESPCQEPAVVWDSRSVKVNEVKNTIESLKQQNKDLEHQLEEEKKENKKRHQAEWGLKLQIAILNTEKTELHTDLCRTKGVLRHFEEESKDLAGHLQCSSQCIGELERALSAVATKQKKDISFSSRSRELSWWRLKKSTEEKARLKTQLTRLKELLTQVQLERDQYAHQIEGERARRQQRMSKLSQEIDTLTKSKNHYTHRVKELQSKLKNQMAEPLPLEPPAVPCEVDLQHLRKQLERVAGELQAQVEKNQRISLLNRVQEERLQKQEERLQEQQERLQQLAKPQSVFEELVRSPAGEPALLPSPPGLCFPTSKMGQCSPHVKCYF
ncbi:golgin subfamily A member 8S-like [Hylobates moloch]|uniref:golgin subfamily A member 8S-like n=1 Tax=Hylobates moloch TaxID=81572 RepID=UPI0026775721|nr:golgin subfamily A member 8S-like [Hylobates moloch]